MNINSTTLTGNLTRDPEVRSVGDTSVCDLGVAVNDRVKRNGEWEDHPSFIDVTVWGRQAEACGQYLSKGSPVAVQGKLRQDRWQNDQGENRSKVKVLAQAVQFLGGRQEGAQSVSGGSNDLPVSTENAADDDIPFARPEYPDVFGERERARF